MSTMIWNTFFPSFDGLQKALRLPDPIIAVRGHLYGRVRKTYLETLIDEMGRVWVEGPGWRAEVWREGQRFRAAELGAQRR